MAIDKEKSIERIADFIKLFDLVCKGEGVEWKRDSWFRNDSGTRVQLSVFFPDIETFEETEKEPDFREDMPRKTSGAINTLSMDPAELSGHERRV